VGEAKRRREAAFSDGPWPGGPGRCPTCLSTKVMMTDMPADLEFYGRRVAFCKCGAAWEPIDESQIWDRSDPYCSGGVPCDNCAFRSGSPERQDSGKWNDMMSKLKSGSQFFCHKGVPIAPKTENGFAYPSDRAKLRLCRGYLNALGKWWDASHCRNPRDVEVDRVRPECGSVSVLDKTRRK